MKLAINLLPPEPEAQAIEKKKRTVILFSELLLVTFLLVNFGIFGFYWFLTKNTAKTLAAIKREEATITSFEPREKFYRALYAKLSFLSSLWQKKNNPAEVIDFAQALLVPEVTLLKISFNQDGLATLGIKASDSEGLENYLNRVSETEKNGQIKDIKITSASKNKDGGYDVNVNFKFLGKK